MENRKKSVCGYWIYIVALAVTMASKVVGNEEHRVKLAEGNTKFALDIYRQIASKQGNGNIFFSPGSISVALAMTYLGARNNTAKEMKTAMSLDALEDEHLHAAFEELNTNLQETGGNYTLHIANRLFGEQSYNFLQEFLDKQMTHYKAQLAPVDFIKHFEAARQLINQWVEDQTAQKIKDLLPGGSLDSLTRLVLVNAIYFKGKWAQQFKPQDTRPGDFWLTANDKVQVPMMHQKKHFKYGLSRELNDCKILELPYVGGKLSMFILLPSRVDGLAELERKLTVAHLVDPVKAFRMRSVETEVAIPKFKLEQSFDLKEVLGQLGMRDLFSPTDADLSGMDGDRSLYVSRVRHKAYIRVNEKGSEAAAATGVIARTKSIPRRYSFIVDKPFLFMLCDNQDKAVLFVGRVSRLRRGRRSKANVGGERRQPDRKPRGRRPGQRARGSG